MKQNITHNDGIKNFADVARYLELEAKRIEALKPMGQAYVAESSKLLLVPSASAIGTRMEITKDKAVEQQKKGKGKFFGKKIVILCSYSLSEFNVSSTVLLTDSYPLWTMDSGATDHVARDRAAYVEYRRIPTGSKWIYVGNNARVEVKGIGTCELRLRGGRTLYLQDVLYAPDIR